MRTLQNLIIALTLLAFRANAQTLTISHATIIDTVTGKTQPNSTVVINGNRITSVTPSANLTPKAGQVIDAHGQYLIPGTRHMV